MFTHSNVLKEIIDTERKYIEDLKSVSEVSELNVLTNCIYFVPVLFSRQFNIKSLLQ